MSAVGGEVSLATTRILLREELAQGAHLMHEVFQMSEEPEVMGNEPWTREKERAYARWILSLVQIYSLIQHWDTTPVWEAAPVAAQAALSLRRAMVKSGLKVRELLFDPELLCAGSLYAEVEQEERVIGFLEKVLGSQLLLPAEAEAVGEWLALHRQHVAVVLAGVEMKKEMKRSPAERAAEMERLRRQILEENKDRPPSRPTVRQFPFPLGREYTVAELEQLHPGPNDGRIPQRPFGFLHAEWLAFQAQMQPGDRIHAYESPRETWRALCGSAGYVLVRGEEIVGTIVMRVS